MRLSRIPCACAAMLLGALQAAQADDQPQFVARSVVCTNYDGTTDDLLTGGLGKSGLQNALPPSISAVPTAGELRRRAIYVNYRALVDMTTNGGYGVFYGPNIDLAGNPTLGEGLIAGEECLAFAADRKGNKNVTMMLQIPASFDPADACIVAAPSSGSRGVYGAIGTAGEWGLKRGCAVAYTDKGTGNGAHDLQNDTVNLIDGLREAAAVAGDDSNFTARIDAATLADFNVATPNRFAFKHAHSQENPEADWGRDVLRSIEFAFWQLNQRFGEQNGHGKSARPTITKRNTLVIASSVSNGGGASLAAAEQDFGGLIDGVAVGEPQIQPVPLRLLTIRRGGLPVARQASGLYDYGTVANLYQPCASQAAANASSPLLAAINATRAQNRCAALKAAGLLVGSTLAEQADESLAILHGYGWEPESDLLHATHYAFATPAIAVTYANAYSRASVADNLCGFSFAAADALGNPIAAAPANVAQVFANGNGIPPTAGLAIINNLSLGGPLADGLSLSSAGVQDLNADGAACLRSLSLGRAAVSGAPLTGDLATQAQRVRANVRDVRASGLLRGKPAIIVHGRADTLVPVNHSSRPYFALNQLIERKHSRLSYIEIANGQHFDAFLGFAGYDTRLVPVHLYVIRALNLMYDHLKHGTSLPPSQVVRTTPRGGVPGAAPALTLDNVPAIADAPASTDLIRFSGTTLDIPD